MKVQGNGAAGNAQQLLAAVQNQQPKAAKGNDADGDNDGTRSASKQGNADSKGGNVNVTA